MKIKTLLEMADPKKLDKVAWQTLLLAEEMAFEESEEGKRSVTGDQVASHLPHIIEAIEKKATKYLEQEYSDET